MNRLRWNTILVEDEPADCKLLKKLLKKHCPQVKVLAEVSKAEDALVSMRELDVRLVFCTALLRDGSSFELLDQIDKLHVHIVFLSVDEAYAMRAFRQNIFDYLIKPITPEVLIGMMERLEIHALKMLQLNEEPVEPVSTKINSTILIKSTGVQHVVHLADIIHLEGDGNYATITLSSGGKILVSKPLKYFEHILPAKYFYRVHQSHIVNILSVKSVQNSDNQHVVLNNDHTVPLSRRKKDPFLFWLAQKLNQNEGHL